MTVLKCFSCEYTTSKVSELENHLWKMHRPEGSEDTTICPECEYPITDETFPYHYGCLFDTADVGLFADPFGYLCELCGDHQPEQDKLETHLGSHSEVDKLDSLSDKQVCDHCDTVLRPGEIASHYTCLRAVNNSADPSNTDSISCPKTNCSFLSGDKSDVLWHLWIDHLNHTGPEGTCEGCSQSITFGELQSHLSCLKNCNPPDNATLLPVDNTTCVICGLSVYSRGIVHRHYLQNHATSSISACPECDMELVEENKEDILEHVTCLVSGAMDPISEAWHCPLCEVAVESQTQFDDHLLEMHIDTLADAPVCNHCDSQIDSVPEHVSCLLADSAVSKRITQPDSNTITPVSSVEDRKAYFDDLEEFVSMEAEAQRDENRHQYEEQSIEDLVRQKKAVPDLLHVSSPSHPKYDQQLVYQHTDAEDDETEEIDLFDEYEVYIESEVLLASADIEHEELPVKGIVTFVDGPQIGVSPQLPNGRISDHLLSALSEDDAVYHCSDLLNPKPFQRRQDAISQVKSKSELKNLVLGETDLNSTPVTLPPEATDELNEYQSEAVERALGSDDILCIHGPPGTGKTRTLRRLIRLAVADGKSVLAASHSNQAVDNLLVGSSTVTSPDEDSLHYVATPAGGTRRLPYELERKREENPEDETVEAEISAIMDRPRELSIARIGENTNSRVVEREYQNQSIRDADVVGGTMSSLAEIDVQTDFDIAIIDEAGQAAQPVSFIPLLRGNRVILAGDHLQLPPYAADETAKDAEMHISLFEHIMDLYEDSVSVMLRKQYRMNEQIAAFPSEYIYDGALATADAAASKTIDNLKPMMAVDVDGDEQTDEGSYSKYNPTEAEIVADHVKLLQMKDVPLEDVGVITPYTAQISTIRRAISEEIGSVSDLKIATVDSFQGSERDAIIVSFVRSNAGHHTGFLSSPEEGMRRLNVAITRAKRRLVLIGDWNTLGTPAEYEEENTTSKLYENLYKYLNNKDLVKKL